MERVMRLIEHAKTEDMARAVSKRIAEALAAAISERGEAVFIATGGSTAPAIYEALRHAPLDWARVTILLSDERFVPADHPASNVRQLRECLLQGQAAAARVLPFDPAAPSPQAAALAFNRQVPEGVRADVALLGVGADLHVASVFPEGEGAAEAFHGQGAAYAVTPHPLPENAPYARITLSLKALANAGLMIFALTGAEKRARLEQGLTDQAQLPAIALLQRLGPKAEVHWRP